ncbi:MAG: DUF2784 domain-containing protein [Planctomycetes bacterium]|nr:DUF2784 domain-containing protein [Planctomycetota bacterium]NBY02553.1 DUF2784 domain-containing protein [Planctomycetota bacterium]
MHYSFLADALVIFHLAFVAFVVLGQLAILVGIIFKKIWARAFVFRSIHLLCIGIVAIEGMLDVECPLTVWERNLRTEAGQDISEAPFIPQLANRILFYPGIPHVYFERMHIAFGCLVLITFLVWPPRLPKKTEESLN